MDALAATRDELMRHGVLTSRLIPYAGPQCYPHIIRSSDQYRGHANEAVLEEADPPVVNSLQVKNQDGSVVGGSVMRKECWLQCTCVGCKKWRCVDAASLECLLGEDFLSPAEMDMDWHAWLADRARGSLR